MLPPTRDQLLSDLRGQEVRIPNLQSLFIGWPNLVNPHQDTVVSVVQHVLETHSMTKAVEMKLKRANLGLLIASWYPFASEQRLKDLTYFVCWMYMVDDAIIDKVSWPGLDNAAAFNTAYMETMTFVQKSLKLEGTQDEGQPSSEIAAIDSFRGIGELMCAKSSVAQRQRFYATCKSTMDGYRTEQQLRVAGRMPTWDEYWNYREGSSCISMCVAMIEYAIESNIPEDVVQSQEMQQLWVETVVLNWLTNDIVSAKKELGEGFIENAVALGAIDTRRAQDGLDRTVQLIQEAVVRFEEQAELVEKNFGITSKQKIAGFVNGDKQNGQVDQDRVSQKVSDLVKNCRCMVTGSLSWSLVSPRYNLMVLPKESDRSITFTVGE